MKNYLSSSPETTRQIIMIFLIKYKKCLDLFRVLRLTYFSNPELTVIIPVPREVFDADSKKASTIYLDVN